MLGIALKLLGIGKAILNWFLGLVQALMDFAAKHPLLTAAILLDLLLLYGCWWGYGQHNVAEQRSAQIVELKKDLKEKDSLIEQLYKRLEEYVQALKQAQDGRVADIEQHNKAVQDLKDEADAQLERAQKEAARTKAQRDYYLRLVEMYRKSGKHCGTAEARIKCEEALNKKFIEDMQKVAK